MMVNTTVGFNRCDKTTSTEVVHPLYIDLPNGEGDSVTSNNLWNGITRHSTTKCHLTQ